MTAPAETRCEQTWLYPSQCAHCRGVELPLELTITHTGRITRSRRVMPGDCIACESPIQPGDHVAVTADGTCLHEECAP